MCAGEADEVNFAGVPPSKSTLARQHMKLTLSRSLRATAAATFGVVTTIKKLNKKLQKLNRAPLSPTAAKGAAPSRPTSAVA